MNISSVINNLRENIARAIAPGPSGSRFDIFRPNNGVASRMGLLDRQGNSMEMLRAFRSLVFACVNVRAKEVANAGRLGKFRVVAETEPDAYKDIPLDHPLCQLMRKPNPYFTRWYLWYLTITHLDLTGNSYWWIAKDKLDIPRELWPIPPQFVKIVPGDPRINEGIIRSYIITWGAGQTVEVAAKDIIHLRHPDPLNPYYYGSSLVMRAATEVDIDDFIGKHQREFFKNDAVPAAVVEFPTILHKEVRRAFEDQWIEKFNMKPGRVGYLEGGAKISTLISQKELDYLQSRGINHKIIQAVFGVPDSKLMSGEAVLARATAETLDYNFHKETIDPLLTMIDEQLTNDLAREKFDPSLVIKHDSTVPRDLRLQAELDEKELAMGKVSINEVRERDGYKPLHGGEEPLIHAGLKPLSQLTTT
ncbi:MAG: phage portal protein [Bacteroidota bacterium]